MINIGFVGLGNIFKWQYMAVQDSSQFQVEFVCDCDGNKLDSFYTTYGKNIKGFTSLSSALEECMDIDLVIISTPLHTHFNLVGIVLEKGIAVLVEKPAVDKLEQLEKLQEIADKNNTCIIVSYHAAYGVELIEYLKKRDSIENGLGKLKFFSCELYDPYFNDGNLSEDASSLGGSYLDSCVNALSVLDRLLDISKFFIRNHNKRLFNGIDIASITDYESYDGIRGRIITDWTLAKNYKATTLYFEGGIILLDHSHRIINITKGSHCETIDCSSDIERLHQQYINVFSECSRRLKENERFYDKDKLIHKLLLSYDH